MEQTIIREKKKMVSEKSEVTPDTEVKGQPSLFKGQKEGFFSTLPFQKRAVYTEMHM